jgi:hypothetical protein
MKKFWAPFWLFYPFYLTLAAARRHLGMRTSILIRRNDVWPGGWMGPGGMMGGPRGTYRPGQARRR